MFLYIWPTNYPLVSSIPSIDVQNMAMNTYEENSS